MNVRRALALLAIVVSVAACSASASADETADGSGGELQATTWVLRSYNVAGALTIVPDDQFADADFMSQRVRGFSGCNDYDAVYRTGGRMLLVGPSAGTLMSCGEATDAFETSYLTLLGQSRFYNVNARDNTLTIRGADLTVLLVFDAAPANPLLGSWIVGIVRADAELPDRPAPGHGADGCLPAEQGRRLVRLQHVPGAVHHEWLGRRDRPARVDPDGLPG